MKIYLAPIMGVTGRPFRDPFNSVFGGLDRVFAPFLSTPRKNRLSDFDCGELFPVEDVPVVPQVLAGNFDELSNFTRLLKSDGFREVNWNLGCPFPLVMKRDRGAGMLRFPDRIEKTLEEYFEEFSEGPALSIKLRLGFDDPDTVLSLVSILNRFPLKEITLHPRTALQNYGGKADLERFGMFLELSAHPVIYNGDVRKQEDFELIAKRFPALGGLMIGRGVLRDPFLPSLVKGGERKLELLEVFNRKLFDSYERHTKTDRLFLGRMKEFWSYHHDFYPGGGELFDELKKIDSIDDFKNRVFDIIDDFTASSSHF